MSTDSVDDIHAAEDLIAELIESLSYLIEGPDEMFKVVNEPIKVLAAARRYCRPTCGQHGVDRFDEDGITHSSSCGCPCHDRDYSAGVEVTF